jgi:hypothetical protein
MLKFALTAYNKTNLIPDSYFAQNFLTGNCPAVA